MYDRTVAYLAAHNAFMESRLALVKALADFARKRGS